MFLFCSSFTFQRGPNQEPYVAAIFVAIIAVSFIMIGNLNALAPIVTMPFLLTYAAIDYAYFKLAMSYDIRQQQKSAERKPQDLNKSADTQLISFESKGNGKKLSYGSGTVEKHDFGDVKFSQQDAMEKDDSQEKENVNKDDTSYDYNSPLDMKHNTEETKVNVEGEDAELERGDTQVFGDTTKLIEKESNKENNREEGTKDKTEARERRKGEFNKNVSTWHVSCCA